MSDSSLESLFDSVFELFIALLFCTVSLGVLVFQIRSLSVVEDEYLNSDKVAVSDVDAVDPFVMTGYQVYMIGYAIDNYGPEEKNGIAFADSDDKRLYVTLSTDTFHHSYTVRNRMISGKDSDSVASMLQTGVVTTLRDHYRGFDNTQYRLSLCDDYVSELSPIMSDDGLTAIEKDRKEFMWTIQKQ